MKARPGFASPPAPRTLLVLGLFAAFCMPLFITSCGAAPQVSKGHSSSHDQSSATETDWDPANPQEENDDGRKQEVQKYAPNKGAHQDAEANSSDPKDSDLLLWPQARDPSLSEVTLKLLRVEENTHWKTDNPQLVFHTTNADYVKILRCRADFPFTLPDGRSLARDQSQITKDSSSTELLKWAWLEAAGNSQECHIVSNLQTGSTLNDIASPAGEYYYAVNPCISGDSFHSQGASNCSNRIKISNHFKVTKSLVEALREEVSEYLSAESQTTGTLSKLQYAAQRIAINRELCERNQNAQERTGALWGRLTQFASLGIASVITAGIATLPGLASGIGSLVQATGNGIDSKKVAEMALALFAQPPKLPPTCAALTNLFQEAKAFSQIYAISTTELNTRARRLAAHIQTAVEITPENASQLKGL